MSENFVFMASTLTNKTKPPDKPPDKGDNFTPADMKMSFRDKMLADSQPTPVRKEIDFLAEGLASVELVGGNRLLPTVSFSDSVIKEYSREWQDALIVTIIGKKLGFKVMRERLKYAWKLAGDFDMMDIENGYFMVKFNQAPDREKVLQGGPWMIFDHYVAITAWTPEFDSTTASVSKTLVWVRLTGLNMLYYDKNFLIPIASAIGRPFKIDLNTLSFARGRFARICVEIDLNQPVVGKVCVQGNWHKVEYEGLHVICSRCGCYGHVARNCKIQPQLHSSMVGTDMATGKTGEGQNPSLSERDVSPSGELDNNDALIAETATTEVHGEWLVVSRKKRNGKTGKGPIVKAGFKPGINANRFNALHEEGTNSVAMRQTKGLHSVKATEKEGVLLNKKRLRLENKERNEGGTNSHRVQTFPPIDGAFNGHSNYHLGKGSQCSKQAGHEHIDGTVLELEKNNKEDNGKATNVEKNKGIHASFDSGKSNQCVGTLNVKDSLSSMNESIARIHSDLTRHGGNKSLHLTDLARDGINFHVPISVMQAYEGESNFASQNPRPTCLQLPHLGACKSTLSCDDGGGQHRGGHILMEKMKMQDLEFNDPNMALAREENVVSIQNQDVGDTTMEFN
ncbi:hypothetical protein TanjilG_21843 [Lupinus angustifolius]|uniref:CCHC-type domain-containing protein n=1 Tax=Lupinus angustifolius TaxID=3871 RepID=A0A1J7HRY2_LUPAN|nr:hypothetical protein TanjilG_21843 [Lupinus angustifolius]